MNTREGRVGVKGVGVDVVDLGAFAAFIAEPGTRFANVFSATERRQARDAAERRGAVAPEGDEGGSGGGDQHAGKEHAAQVRFQAASGNPRAIAPLRF